MPDMYQGEIKDYFKTQKLCTALNVHFTYSNLY